MSDNKFDFSSFQFPIVKNIKAGTIADKLKSAFPMTIKEAANGRTIKAYPKKYDTFASAEDLKNYILDILHLNSNLKAEWLDINTSHLMPFNLRSDIYYTGVQVVSITCHQPPEHPMDDLIVGQTICELKPGDPLVAEAYKIIDSIKKELNKN